MLCRIVSKIIVPRPFVQTRSCHGGQGWCLHGVVHILQKGLFFPKELSECGHTSFYVNFVFTVNKISNDKELCLSYIKQILNALRSCFVAEHIITL